MKAQRLQIRFPSEGKRKENEIGEKV